jgi:hypothetical protein
MDFLRMVEIGSGFAVLVLPVWIVWRVPRYYLSVPIGALMFWGWLVVDGFLLLRLDPEYNSIAPALLLLVGWAMGAVYCCLLMAVREIVSPRRKSRSVGKAGGCTVSQKVASFHHALGLAVWGALSVLCICYPFIDRARYGETDWMFLEYYLFACGDRKSVV